MPVDRGPVAGDGVTSIVRTPWALADREVRRGAGEVAMGRSVNLAFWFTMRMAGRVERPAEEASRSVAPRSMSPTPRCVGVASIVSMDRTNRAERILLGKNSVEICLSLVEAEVVE